MVYISKYTLQLRFFTNPEGKKNEGKHNMDDEVCERNAEQENR